ncbi:hypothetical protein Dimus_038190 [Dionaea muscipula]
MFIILFELIDHVRYSCVHTKTCLKFLIKIDPMANSSKSIVSDLQEERKLVERNGLRRRKIQLLLEDHEVLQPITYTMRNDRPATEALGLVLGKGNSVKEFKRETRGGKKVGAFYKYSHFTRDCTEKNICYPPSDLCHSLVACCSMLAELNDSWIVDSGTTQHMTKDR